MGKICIYCGVEFSNRETKSCSICARKKNNRQLVRLSEKKANGICIQCGKNKAEEGRVRCRKCADKINLQRRSKTIEKQKLIERKNKCTKENVIKIIYKKVGKPSELCKIMNDASIIRSILGGKIEEVKLPTGETLLLNDEGLLLKLAFNFEVGYYKIYGDAIVIGKDGIYYSSLSEEVIKKWLTMKG